MSTMEKRSHIEYIHSQFWFWFNAEFFAVGLSAFLGVYIRVMIQNQFDGHHAAHPSSGTGPFMQIFFSQTYLIPNFLGCFIMSFCIETMKSITDISLPLYKALTTGLCGCITTFSTWMNVAVNSSFGYFSWYQILTMICLEFWLTWGAFTLGFSAAKLFIDFWYRFYKIAFEVEVFVEEQEESQSRTVSAPVNSQYSLEVIEEGGSYIDDEDSKNSDNAAVSAAPAPALSTCPELKEKITYQPRHSLFSKQVVRVDANTWDSSHIVERYSHPMPTRVVRTCPSRTRKHYAGFKYGQLHPIASRISVWRENGEDGYEHEKGRVASSARIKSVDSSLSGYSTADSVNERTSRTSWAMLSRTHARSNSNTSFVSRNDSDVEMRLSVSAVYPSNVHPNQNSLLRTSLLAPNMTSPTPAVTMKNLTTVQLTLKYEYVIWVTLFFLTASFIWLPFLAHSNNPTFKDSRSNGDLFRSVALAPFGAWLRWALTRLPKIKASWPDMNPQTMLANMIAVTLECSLLVFCTSSWVPALGSGFNGSCSTVSTFFAELHALYLERGPYVAFRYGLVTVGLAVIIIQIIRGAATNNPH